jgi:NAD-dependent SIR2 family protein deacetylase
MCHKTKWRHELVLVRTALDKADAIIIGAGSGISTAAGLRYDDTDFFNITFPGYHNRYGLQTINEADFYRFPTPEEHSPTGHASFPPSVTTIPQENPTLIYTVSSRKNPISY